MENNERAFPCTGNPDWQHQEGMTLRDYFAAKAMQGGMSDSATRPCSIEEFEHFAMRAYQVADAMMEARNKPK